jgi:hypothetical protein
MVALRSTLPRYRSSMARRAPPATVTPRMYRHFAVLTLAITLVVGVFADGENRKAAASEVRAAQDAPSQSASTELVRKDGAAHGRFSDEAGFDGPFGAPMDTAGAEAHDGIVLAELADASGGGVPAGFNRYGIADDVWAALTDEQKRTLIARREAEEAAAQAPDRMAQIDDLLAASRARSGEPTRE